MSVCVCVHILSSKIMFQTTALQTTGVSGSCPTYLCVETERLIQLVTNHYIYESLWVS